MAEAVKAIIAELRESSQKTFSFLIYQKIAGSRWSGLKMKKSWNCVHLSHLAFWKSALAEKLERGTLWCTFKNIFPTEERNCCIARTRGGKCTVRRSRRPWWRAGGAGECSFQVGNRSLRVYTSPCAPWGHHLLLSYLNISCHCDCFWYALRCSDLAQLWYTRRALSQRNPSKSHTGFGLNILGGTSSCPWLFTHQILK